MGVVRWRCRFCRGINNSVYFEDAKKVGVCCVFCKQEQTVEPTGTKAHAHWYGARKIA